MPNKLWGIIDVGSNSALLTISEKKTERWESKIHKTESVRLGEDLQKGAGAIGPDSLKRLEKALIRYRQTLRNVGATLAGVLLTEAVRRAENPEAVTEMIERLLGQEAKILTGEEEAYYAWLSVATYHEREDFCSLDIGAGSSEVAQREQGLSLPLGALRLANEKGSFPSEDTLKELRKTIADAFPETYKKQPLYISGGTASALVMVLEKMSEFSETAIEGYALQREELDRVVNQFMGLSAEVIQQFPGLDGRRGEIFLPGLRIIQAWWEELQPKEVFVSTLGIRLGALVHLTSEEKTHEAQ